MHERSCKKSAVQVVEIPFVLLLWIMIFVVVNITIEFGM
jgi:hypothetical protein